MIFIKKDNGDFNDLVVERVLFHSDVDAEEILKQMFPDKTVDVFTDRGGNTVISVDNVSVRVISQ